MPSRDAAHMLTIDVEDWFHILESDDAPDRSRWASLESRVERNTDRLLELLAETGVRGTFFVVGWIAWRHPALIRRIAAAGHELASHSFWHEVVRRHTRESLAADVRAARSLLEDLGGRRVHGFRAPGASITPAEAWAFDVLLEQGYTYDASLCPGVSSHGGFPSQHLGPHLVRSPAGTLVEIPSSTLGVGRVRTPYAGGGYLRLFPYPLLRAALAIDRGRGRPANLYVHPREIDPAQPRMPLPALRRFKYYVGLRSTEPKLRRLLGTERFVPVREWIRHHRPELRDRILDVRPIAGAPQPDPATIPPAPPVSLGSAA